MLQHCNTGGIHVGGTHLESRVLQHYGAKEVDPAWSFAGVPEMMQSAEHRVRPTAETCSLKAPKAQQATQRV